MSQQYGSLHGVRLQSPMAWFWTPSESCVVKHCKVLAVAKQALCWLPGKTTFIKHLLGREYPGIHIGPEPTTDRFVIVDHALEERRTPGNTLIVQPDKPYQVLACTST